MVTDRIVGVAYNRENGDDFGVVAYDEGTRKMTLSNNGSTFEADMDKFEVVIITKSRVIKPKKV